MWGPHKKAQKNERKCETITHLQHHNKHEYNIDSLLNIQFATVLLQHYIAYLQQHTNNTNTMLGKHDYNIDTIT
jgi:hypothetical protein